MEKPATSLFVAEWNKATKQPYTTEKTNTDVTTAPVCFAKREMTVAVKIVPTCITRFITLLTEKFISSPKKGGEKFIQKTATVWRGAGFGVKKQLE